MQFKKITVAPKSLNNTLHVYVNFDMKWFGHRLSTSLSFTT